MRKILSINRQLEALIRRNRELLAAGKRASDDPAQEILERKEEEALIRRKESLDPLKMAAGDQLWITLQDVEELILDEIYVGNRVWFCTPTNVILQTIEKQIRSLRQEQIGGASGTPQDLDGDRDSIDTSRLYLEDLEHLCSGMQAATIKELSRITFNPGLSIPSRPPPLCHLSIRPSIPHHHLVFSFRCCCRHSTTDERSLRSDRS